MNTIDYTETFNAIATALGGVFNPDGYEDDAGVTRGWLVFGNPDDWRTLRIFVEKCWWEYRFRFSYGGQVRYNQGGREGSLGYCLRDVVPEIFASASRPAQGIAKDVKRRLIDKLVTIHPANVQRIEEEIAADQARIAWWEKMGLGTYGRGRVWRDGDGDGDGAWAALDARSNTSANLEIRDLTRGQAEKIIKFLREGL